MWVGLQAAVRMTGAQQEEVKQNTLSVSELPLDALQHVCSFLDDPLDLASFHMVDKRYVRSGAWLCYELAARAAACRCSTAHIRCNTQQLCDGLYSDQDRVQAT